MIVINIKYTHTQKYVTLCMYELRMLPKFQVQQKKIEF